MTNKWILCSEEMPKEDIRVLVELDNGWQQVAFLQDGIWMLLCNEYIEVENKPFRNVIAWMPLPEPYEEGRFYSCEVKE